MQQQHDFITSNIFKITTTNGARNTT